MHIFTEGVPQTVHDMAALRDFRRERQAELFARVARLYVPPAALVMFSLVIPGPIKNNSYLESLFDAGCAAFSALLCSEGIEACEYCTDRRPAGSTAFWLLHADAGRIKAFCAGLERTHPLGSLWDFDVFSAFEQKLSAESTGFPPRTCLICTEPAKVCARSRKHSVCELQEKISALYRACS
ncbi:MAG: citrate lyase holo-[acyl-carrier protein] synthase [Treponema sp.]